MHANFSHLLSNMIGLFFFGPFIERQISSKRFIQVYMVCAIGAAILQTGVSYFENKQFEEEMVEIIQSPDPSMKISFVRSVIAMQGKEMQRNQRRLTEDEELIKDSEIKNVNNYIQNTNNAKMAEEVNSIIGSIAIRVMANRKFLGASGAIFGLLMVMFLLFPNLKLQLLFPPIPIKAKFLVGFYAAYEIYKLMEQAPGDNVAHFAHLAGMLFSFIMIKLIWKMRRIY